MFQFLKKLLHRSPATDCSGNSPSRSLDISSGLGQSATSSSGDSPSPLYAAQMPAAPEETTVAEAYSDPEDPPYDPSTDCNWGVCGLGNGY